MLQSCISSDMNSIATCAVTPVRNVGQLSQGNPAVRFGFPVVFLMRIYKLILKLVPVASMNSPYFSL